MGLILNLNFRRGVEFWIWGVISRAPQGRTVLVWSNPMPKVFIKTYG
jgi:hypothetical protein